MPITIDGAGIITGLNAGGLPDASVTTSEIADAAVTTGKLETSVASGVAKAWVNFNGTGTVSIRAAFNCSSVSDNGVGDYTLNFATAMADANYAIVGLNESGQQTITVKLRASAVGSAPTLKTATQARVYTSSTSADFDCNNMNFVVLR